MNFSSNLFITLCMFMSIVQAFSQCTVEIGEEKSICTNLFGVDSTYLGDDLVISGNSGPYKYKWETSAQIGSNFIHASTYLNDTSLSNPLLHTYGPDTLDFKLTVTDDNLETCSDSLRVIFSVWFLKLQHYNVYIEPGDSMNFFDGTLAEGSRPPFEYEWNPSGSVHNPDSLYSWASPVEDTEYFLTLTDSLGCEFVTPTLYYVWVGNLNNTEQYRTHPLPFPNPVQNEISVPNFNEIQRVSICDPTGNKVHAPHSHTGEFLTINVEGLATGTYYMTVYSPDFPRRFKFIKE